MALEDYKITTSDYTSKDITSLADKPALTAAQLKARFDSLVKNVVAVKLNGLIDALVTAIGNLITKVTGGTTGNFASLSADGSVADSGKKAADFEAAGAVDTHNADITAHGGIPTRHTVYKDSAGSGWYKILSFPATGEIAVRVEGFSGSAYWAQRGHWQIIINRLADGIRADLIFATNGITPSSFDVRLDDDTINIYFYTPQWTRYRILSEAIYGDIALTTYNTEETPSGTAETVYAPRMEYSASITLNAIIVEYDVTVSWATTDMWFDAIRTDATLSGFLHFLRARCSTNGTVTLTLNQFPGSTYDGQALNVKISGWK